MLVCTRRGYQRCPRCCVVYLEAWTRSLVSSHPKVHYHLLMLSNPFNVLCFLLINMLTH